MKRIEQNGLVWYESEALNELGIRHGFFTRVGGVSEPPFDSLNVKYEIEDSEENVRENRKRILDSMSTDKLAFAKLAHSADFASVNVGTDFEAVDGLITDQKGLALGLSVADCLPIIVSDGKQLGIIHAGWRGTVAGITTNVVSGLINGGLDLENTVAVNGPCICKQHFEVNDEAAQKLRELAGENTNDPTPYHADLLRLNIRQLNDCGISQIDSLNICSFESDEFYSFRRGSGKTGRNMAIALLS